VRADGGVVAAETGRGIIGDGVEWLAVGFGWRVVPSPKRYRLREGGDGQPPPPLATAVAEKRSGTLPAATDAVAGTTAP